MNSLSPIMRVLCDTSVKMPLCLAALMFSFMFHMKVTVLSGEYQDCSNSLSKTQHQTLNKLSWLDIHSKPFYTLSSLALGCTCLTIAEAWIKFPATPKLKNKLNSTSTSHAVFIKSSLMISSHLHEIS